MRLLPFNNRFYITNLLKNQIDSISRIYLSKEKSAILVDFGCGHMPYRTIIEPRIVNYIGVDLPDNEKADFQIDANGKVNLPDNFTDVVFSTQVLEHVEHPLGYLQECRRMLKPNGLLILSTHGYWIYHPHPKDLWRWTSEGLLKIIQDTGFQVIEIKGVMGLAATGLYLFQDGIVEKMPRIMKPLFYFCIQGMAWIVDKANSTEEKNTNASVFILVARKKGYDET